MSVLGRVLSGNERDIFWPHWATLIQASVRMFYAEFLELLGKSLVTPILSGGEGKASGGTEHPVEIAVERISETEQQIPHVFTIL